MICRLTNVYGRAVKTDFLVGWAISQWCKQHRRRVWCWERWHGWEGHDGYAWRAQNRCNGADERRGSGDVTFYSSERQWDALETDMIWRGDGGWCMIILFFMRNLREFFSKSAGISIMRPKPAIERSDINGRNSHYQGQESSYSSNPGSIQKTTDSLVQILVEKCKSLV